MRNITITVDFKTIKHLSISILYFIYIIVPLIFFTCFFINEKRKYFVEKCKKSKKRLCNGCGKRKKIKDTSWTN